MLLPHGFEGQGPEHSSARLERFLDLAAEDNMQVGQPDHAGPVLFHCLRRQVAAVAQAARGDVAEEPAAPPGCVVSSLDDLADGFHRNSSRVLGDPDVEAASARKILLCSGKIYYELVAERARRSADDVAILRLEQYYPLSQTLLAEHLSAFRDGTSLVWVQEEPINMGAWGFLRRTLGEAITERWPLTCESRPESASPATGSAAAHKLEQAALLERALA